MNKLNNPVLSGSSLESIYNPGQFYSIHLIKYLKKKVGLKIGLGFGQVSNNLIYTTTPEFIDFQEIFTFVDRKANFHDTRFTELSLGINLPIDLSNNSLLNVFINTKASFVIAEDQSTKAMLKAAVIHFDEDIVLFNKTYIMGDLLHHDQQFQFGLGFGINYRYHLKKLPLAFYLGLISSYTPKSYAEGWVHFIGDSDTLELELSKNLSYLGLELGVSYIFKASTY